MRISSPAFENNSYIPSKYTCDGQEINPALEFNDVPSEAKSLVLIMDDPDAIGPAGKVWDHWIVFDMPADTKRVLEAQEPKGVRGIGTSNNLKYHGPRPPDGEHRYFFKLYALDTMLGLPEAVTKNEIEAAMDGHILGQAQIVGVYESKQ